MKKKFNHYVSLSLLLLSVLPFSLVSAETVEEVPTGGTTISSMADDPLKELKEKAANQVPTIESTPESESVEDTPTNESETKEDVPKTEDTTESKPKPQTRGGGIGPQTMNLIEGNPNDPGVDIDAQFAQVLRTDVMAQNLGTSWSGYGKAVNQLTDDDMAALTTITMSYKNLSSLKGVEYAFNLTGLNCVGNPLITLLDVSKLTKLDDLTITSTKITNLDISQNTKLINLSCLNNNLTSLDISKNVELVNLRCSTNSIGSLDISNNSKLRVLSCYSNQLTSINLVGADKLDNLDCSKNQLTSLDTSKNNELRTLRCDSNKLSSLDVSLNSELGSLYCGDNLLTNLNLVGANKLGLLDCRKNYLPVLNLSQNIDLAWLDCGSNFSLSTLDVSQNLKLLYLSCSFCDLTSLDVSQNKVLTDLTCSNNKLTTLTVAGADALKNLDASVNDLTSINVNQNVQFESVKINWCKLLALDVSNLSKLTRLEVGINQLSNLDISQNLNLRELHCRENKLSNITIGQHYKLETVTCDKNQLSNLESFKQCENLKLLSCSENQVSDITAVNGLSQLSSLEVSQQTIYVPVPSVSGGEADVDILRTTAHLGLNVQKGSIGGMPILSGNGDKVHLSNVTREDMNEKHLEFNYDDWQLVEGASAGYKRFDGNIRFFTVSELENDLKVLPKKQKSGETVEWTWEIKSVTIKKAENIKAKLTLPSGLVINPASIKINNSPASIADIDGTNFLGDLDKGQTFVINFQTKVLGTAEEWLEATGKIEWEDDTISSPYQKQTKGSVQILDEEQSYLPKDSAFMGILSTPIYFNYGVKNQKITAQTFGLASSDYQSNTNVVTDGFYTRIKDDRAISTGWKLTAKLSDFKDSSNQPMPNGTGTMLKLENMSIERVTDRDTPQEVIDPTPSGLDVPSSVQATETLVAGQSTAKTIVSAQPNEGQDTWQLRMPFDKVSLSIPANAGKKGTVYKANLTWSLDDTP